MKRDIDDLEETYTTCVQTGRIKEKNAIDVELIKSLTLVAKRGLAFIEDKEKSIRKESDEWTFVFRDHYESLRGLIEAFLLFDKVTAENHQCKNAYLCFQHPELELDWNFLETARLKRNAINYRGTMMTYEDWKRFELAFQLHISKLSREIKKKLGKQ